MATNEGFLPSGQDPEAAPPPPSPSEPPPPYQPSYGTADAVPPPYEAHQDASSDSPPSYESLFGELRAAKQSSSSVAQFFKKFLVIVLSTLGCTVCVGIILAIPISMIVIGVIYRTDCPRQSYIPIYLIVGGCFGVIKNLSNIVQRVKNRQEDQDDDNAKSNPLDGTLNCFLIGWFIAGNVWIYSIHGDFNDNPLSNDYCNSTLYSFAFWITTATYILLGCMCCTLCCVGMVANCLGAGHGQTSSN